MTCQRWRLGRDSYRPAGEVIVPREYEVSIFLDDATPKRFVLEHHYTGSYPAARWRFGLYRHGALVGVAIFSHPCQDLVLTNVFGAPAIESVELGRFILLDEVPGNGESWFLARCFQQLRKDGLRGVLSFSDPVPRTDAEGRVIFRGHIGTIYQAHNAVYLGRGTPRTLHLLPDGRIFNARAASKLRSGERGHRYAARLLSGVLSLRRLRHPGNHKYAWSFHRSLRLDGRPYPKAGA